MAAVARVRAPRKPPAGTPGTGGFHYVTTEIGQRTELTSPQWTKWFVPRTWFDGATGCSFGPGRGAPMADSASGQAAWFSATRRGFDSLIRCAGLVRLVLTSVFHTEDAGSIPAARSRRSAAGRSPSAPQPYRASAARRVVHRPRKTGVAGSSPAAGSRGDAQVRSAALHTALARFDTEVVHGIRYRDACPGRAWRGGRVVRLRCANPLTGLMSRARSIRALSAFLP